jgi:hypothetical protein
MTADLNVTSDDFDDDDFYDPPMPYDYTRQWKQMPEQWALDCATELIWLFENGPKFYENLDATVIEQWIFETHPDLRDTLDAKGRLDTFRAELSRYCRKLSAAGSLANEILGKGKYLGNMANIPQCDEFFPGFLLTVHQRPEHEWEDRVSAPVAELCGKWRNRVPYEYPARHDTERAAPYSRIADVGFEWLDLEKVRASRGTATAYLLGKDSFPAHLGHMTLERFVLVISAPCDVVFKSLRRSDCTDFYPVESLEGSTQWVVSFGDGSLTIPLLQHEELLLSFRNRVPVLFLLDDDMLFVEYDWNPMAFGREYIETAKQTEPAVGSKRPRPSPTNKVHTETLQVHSICPIPWGKGPIDDGRYRVSALLSNAT